MNKKNLDSVCREEKKTILSNLISQCMIENHMTLENLDEACEVVREIYRKNAIMKGGGEADVTDRYVTEKEFLRQIMIGSDLCRNAIIKARIALIWNCINSILLIILLWIALFH